MICGVMRQVCERWRQLQLVSIVHGGCIVAVIIKLGLGFRDLMLKKRNLEVQQLLRSSE